MSQKKLLIVEDNELNLKLYMYALKTVKVEILVAKNGDEALNLIRTQKPDVMVLDIQIPGKSGIEVAKIVRANPEFKNMLIIAVTAYSMAGDKEKILGAGCNYYLSKPIDTRAFPKIIQNLLDGKEPPI